MKYLLDTHAMIWATITPEKLSKKTKEILENTNNEILVSSISFWEISIKFSLGKFDLGNHIPDDFPVYCRQMGFSLNSLTCQDAANYHILKPVHHKDPFDRMLIHLAIKSNIPLISKDETIKLYESEGLKVIWN